jgi:hypothetical protein
MSISKKWLLPEQLIIWICRSESRDFRSEKLSIFIPSYLVCDIKKKSCFGFFHSNYSMIYNQESINTLISDALNSFFALYTGERVKLLPCDRHYNLVHHVARNDIWTSIASQDLLLCYPK